jgi:hypothetical protein
MAAKGAGLRISLHKASTASSSGLAAPHSEHIAAEGKLPNVQTPQTQRLVRAAAEASACFFCSRSSPSSASPSRARLEDPFRSVICESRARELGLKRPKIARHDFAFVVRFVLRPSMSHSADTDEQVAMQTGEDSGEDEPQLATSAEQVLWVATATVVSTV